MYVVLLACSKKGYDGVLWFLKILFFEAPLYTRRWPPPGSVVRLYQCTQSLNQTVPRHPIHELSMGAAHSPYRCGFAPHVCESNHAWWVGVRSGGVYVVCSDVLLVKGRGSIRGAIRGRHSDTTLPRCVLLRGQMVSYPPKWGILTMHNLHPNEFITPM